MPRITLTMNDPIKHKNIMNKRVRFQLTPKQEMREDLKTGMDVRNLLWMLESTLETAQLLTETSSDPHKFIQKRWKRIRFALYTLIGYLEEAHLPENLREELSQKLMGEVGLVRKLKVFTYSDCSELSTPSS